MANNKMHVRFFKRMLDGLPYQYTSVDSSRATMVYFCVAALEMLGALDEVLGAELKTQVVDWIYNNQITLERAFSWRHCGFKGGSFVGQPFSGGALEGYFSHEYDHGHIAQTYSALAALHTLGDDFGRVDRAAVLRAVGGLQQGDGSFAATSDGSECDMRFLYCACAICAFLDDWSEIDTDRAVGYIHSCKAFDGGFGLVPQQESHGDAQS